MMGLEFIQAKTNDEIKSIFDYTIDAFSDSPDFKWTLDEIQNEVKDGWELYAVKVDEEVIAALFLKREGDALYTKNSALKINHQGSGYSHQIKTFFENKAQEYKVHKLYHYCRVDNFRMYSLNENHGYKKSKRKLGEDEQLVEWYKKLA